MNTMKQECSRCGGSGVIGLSSSSLRYIGRGPVPDDTRGAFEAKCDACRGFGVVEIDCESVDLS